MRLQEAPMLPKLWLLVWISVCVCVCVFFPVPLIIVHDLWTAISIKPRSLNSGRLRFFCSQYGEYDTGSANGLLGVPTSSATAFATTMASLAIATAQWDGRFLVSIRSSCCFFWSCPGTWLNRLYDNPSECSCRPCPMCCCPSTCFEPLPWTSSWCEESSPVCCPLPFGFQCSSGLLW